MDCTHDTRHKTRPASSPLPYNLYYTTLGRRKKGQDKLRKLPDIANATHACPFDSTPTTDLDSLKRSVPYLPPFQTQQQIRRKTKARENVTKKNLEETRRRRPIKWVVSSGIICGGVQWVVDFVIKNNCVMCFRPLELQYSKQQETFRRMTFQLSWSGLNMAGC